MELVTRRWNDLNRKVLHGGVWGIATFILSIVLNNVEPGAGDEFATPIIEAAQQIVTVLSPIVGPLVAYLVREEKPKGT